MTDTILVRVDACLIPILEEIKKTSALRIQKAFKLQDPPELYGTFASKVLAAFYNNKRNDLKINIRIIRDKYHRDFAKVELVELEKDKIS